MVLGTEGRRQVEIQVCHGTVPGPKAECIISCSLAPYSFGDPEKKPRGGGVSPGLTLGLAFLPMLGVPLLPDPLSASEL